MPPKADAIAETKAAVDAQRHAIVLTRTFAAPREQVFEAWTQPEHVACWWDAAGNPLKECQIDLRPGGGFRFVSQGSPDIPPFTGVYLEIVPPESLSFEALGAIGRVSLKEIGGKTLLTVAIECGSRAKLDQFLKMGVDVGTAQTLDNLVAYVDLSRSSRTKIG